MKRPSTNTFASKGSKSTSVEFINQYRIFSVRLLDLIWKVNNFEMNNE